MPPDTEEIGTPTLWNTSPQRVTTASRQQSDEHTRSQNELKAQLELEIQDAVFQSADIVTVFYGPLSTEHSSWLPTGKVVAEAADRLFGFSTSERASYQYLQQLFTEVTSKIPRRKRVVVFSVYDRPVEDKPDGSGELKPDVAGTKKAIADKERVPWRLIIIAVEVKEDNNPGFLQSLTYARCMLAVGDKWFAPLLFYNHRLRTLYGVFVTRFGVFVTPKMALNTPKGRGAMVAMLVRMCSSPGHLAGLEPSKRIDDDGRLCLARGSALSPSLRTPAPAKNWLSLDLLSQRISVMGRATRVYRCSEFKSTPKKPEPRDNPKTISSHDQPAGNVPRPALPRRGTRNAAAAAPARPVSGFVPTSEQPIDVQEWCNLITTAAASGPSASADFLEIPSDTICRSTWLPFPRYDIDEVFVKEIKGLHGCPLLLRSVVARHPLAFAELGKLFLSGKISRVGDFLWHYQTKRPVNAAFQPMVQVYSFYGSIGVPIRTIVDRPLILAHAIKDTMIGLAMAFLKKGRIHRDVTRTNVLVYESRVDVTDDEIRESVETLAVKWPEFQRLIDEDSGFKKLFSTRHAFVNDFEHAVVWDALDRATNVARSGTPEYMSYQLLVHSVEGRQRLHTLLDDLESCIWVPFREVLAAFPQLRTDAEKALFATFATDDYKLICYSKSHLLRLRSTDYEHGSALASTWPLWSRLLPIADELQQTMVGAMNDYRGHSSGPDTVQSSPAPGTPKAVDDIDEQRPEAQIPAGANLAGNTAALIEKLGELSRGAIIRYLLAIKDAIDYFEQVGQDDSGNGRSAGVDEGDDVFG